jgi:hypothetical protein
MAKRTFASVTEIPCECHCLQDLTAIPASPVRFDAEMNEFHFAYAGAKGDAYIVLYHCLFCGGAMPKSLRGGSNTTTPLPA